MQQIGTHVKLPIRVASIFLCLITGIGILAPFLAPMHANTPDITAPPLIPPNTMHLLGTDLLRRDVLSVLIYGCQSALLVAFLSTSLMMLIGCVFGCLASMGNRYWRWLFSTAANVVSTTPLFLVLLTVVALLPRTGIMSVGCLIALLSWPEIFRVVMQCADETRRQPFVLAAKAVGVPNWKIAYRHVLPQVLTPIWARMPIYVAQSITLEASCGFLGLGSADNHVSWGSLLQQAVYDLDSYWLLLFPGLLIFATTAACHLLSDNYSSSALTLRFPLPTKMRRTPLS